MAVAPHIKITYVLYCIFATRTLSYFFPSVLSAKATVLFYKDFSMGNILCVKSWLLSS